MSYQCLITFKLGFVIRKLTSIYRANTLALCKGYLPVTDGFPSQQRARNVFEGMLPSCAYFIFFSVVFPRRGWHQAKKLTTWQPEHLVWCINAKQMGYSHVTEIHLLGMVISPSLFQLKYHLNTGMNQIENTKPYAKINETNRRLGLRVNDKFKWSYRRCISS